MSFCFLFLQASAMNKQKGWGVTNVGGGEDSFTHIEAHVFWQFINGCLSLYVSPVKLSRLCPATCPLSAGIVSSPCDPVKYKWVTQWTDVHLMFDSICVWQLSTCKSLVSYSHSLSQTYSLKDYKQLKSDINLQGLGPDYKAIEKTVSTDLQCQHHISKNCHWATTLCQVH